MRGLLSGSTRINGLKNQSLICLMKPYERAKPAATAPKDTSRQLRSSRRCSVKDCLSNCSCIGSIVLLHVARGRRGDPSGGAAPEQLDPGSRFVAGYPVQQVL